MGIVVRRDADRATVAGLSGPTVGELRERDALLQPVGRWVAASGGEAVGVATAFVRPDQPVTRSR